MIYTIMCEIFFLSIELYNEEEGKTNYLVVQFKAKIRILHASSVVITFIQSHLV